MKTAEMVARLRAVNEYLAAHAEDKGLDMDPRRSLLGMVVELVAGDDEVAGRLAGAVLDAADSPVYGAPGGEGLALPPGVGATYG